VRCEIGDFCMKCEKETVGLGIGGPGSLTFLFFSTYTTYVSLENDFWIVFIPKQALLNIVILNFFLRAFVDIAGGYI